MIPPGAPLLRSFGWEQMPAIANLWVESWQEAMPEIDFEARRGWLCHRIGQLVEGGVRVETAVDAAGRVLGFVTIDPSSGYVDQLVVHPDHWGRGIARTLIDAAAAVSPASLTLDVNEENDRAVRFYTAAGFTVTARGTNPTSGRPTLRMQRR
ncbi:GNAT family N-acetyltransferase [Ancylobacter defluvii]|uniref:Acetyltransferase n=1 Tax=Ancylobacter defluvii TaxID=1282440 RepID=A0A9W6JRZ6_9HYPH|nr:GNAT family N-acetyltransferase [Ancylobacter defluvii]MBS7587501.1 GNAT family N-acetyltransferase [Ancylobacter defluvii]GLK82192.1 acetyltransferase [Ancylobacter defluvii]